MSRILLQKLTITLFILCSILWPSCAQIEQGIPLEESLSSSVTIKIMAGSQSNLIPDDFIGLSFETGSVRSGNAGVKGNFFKADNQQALNLFRELGIKSLRIGGGSVDNNKTFPTNIDIDALFAFAKTSGVKVMYSFRLLNGDITENVSIAKYIWDNHKSELECFAIGNEPDWNSYHKEDLEITDYPSFYIKWRKFAEAIIKVIPEAKFIGPHTGSNYPVPGSKNTNYNGKSWTVNFSNDEKGSGIVSLIAQHNYVGQNASGRTIQEMIDNMLSEIWVTNYYPTLYNANLVPVLENGFPYRLAESNSYSGHVDGGSNCFATALFSLDYLHWWAEHKCSGVNFHNKQWVKNAPIYMDLNGAFQVNPIGYGIKAFDLGSHGFVQPMTISNSKGINLTAYAVRGTNNYYITIINKEHGNSAHNANVIIEALGKTEQAEVIFLCAPKNNVAAKTGITLGGSFIKNDGSWQGKWDSLKSDQNGQFSIKVPAGAATIVKIPIKI